MLDYYYDGTSTATPAVSGFSPARETSLLLTLYENEDTFPIRPCIICTAQIALILVCLHIQPQHFNWE